MKMPMSGLRIHRSACDMKSRQAKSGLMNEVRLAMS